MYFIFLTELDGGGFFERELDECIVSASHVGSLWKLGDVKDEILRGEKDIPNPS